MKQLIQKFYSALLTWCRSLKRWQRNLLIIIIVVLCLYWLLIISNISEWWHWNEWMEHIKDEHL